MQRVLCHSGLALWLALPVAGRADISWLAAEVQAQEARWAAQQGQPRSQPTARRPAQVGQSPRGAVVTGLPYPAGRRTSRPRQRPTRAGPPRTVEETTLAHWILVHARQQQLDPLLVKAVILAESANRRGAISAKGAMGLMQLMPETARRFGITDPYDPAQNIDGGTRYLRWLLDRFGGNVALALAGYNAGEGQVDRFGGIPPFRETQHYVKTVQGNHRWLSQQVAKLRAERTELDPPK